MNDDDPVPAGERNARAARAAAWLIVIYVAAVVTALAYKAVAL